MISRFVFFSFALLAACSPFETATPLPVMQTIRIAITPALQPLSQALQACAAEQPEVILDVMETPAGSLMEVNADLYFRLGEPPQLPAFAAPLGWEEIVVITHLSADSSAVNKPQLRLIFSGMSAADTGADAQVWVPLEGDETRQAFELVLLPNGWVSPFAKLAPDPGAMLSAVVADRAAIGYLPNAWVTNEVRTFDLGIRLPVLVLADEEPQGPAFLLVSCLQGETGQALIMERYLSSDE
jgi:hypothetical protein